MKLQVECIRDVLLQLEELSTASESNDDLDDCSVTISALVEKMSGKYTYNTILYTIKKLNEENFIEANIIYANSQMVHCEIFSITYDGHTLLDSLRTNKVVEKIKENAPAITSIATLFKTALELCKIIL